MSLSLHDSSHASQTFMLRKSLLLHCDVVRVGQLVPTLYEGMTKQDVHDDWEAIKDWLPVTTTSIAKKAYDVNWKPDINQDVGWISTEADNTETIHYGRVVAISDTTCTLTELTHTAHGKLTMLNPGAVLTDPTADNARLASLQVTIQTSHLRPTLSHKDIVYGIAELTDIHPKDADAETGSGRIDTCRRKRISHTRRSPDSRRDACDNSAATVP